MEKNTIRRCLFWNEKEKKEKKKEGILKGGNVPQECIMAGRSDRRFTTWIVKRGKFSSLAN